MQGVSNWKFHETQILVLNFCRQKFHQTIECPPIRTSYPLGIGPITQGPFLREEVLLLNEKPPPEWKPF
jgi:hypothetical protein